MYNSYYQPQTIRQPINLKGRPVASLEEARAIPIDFDGSVFYFPDIANNRIYTKQINLDGTAAFCMYELKETPQENYGTNNFVTRQELQENLEKIKIAISQLTQKTPTEQTEFKF